MATSPDPKALAHAAASAIEQLCATLDDCAREVEDRGGRKVARDRLGADRAVTLSALRQLVLALPQTSRGVAVANEIVEMSHGALNGYVRPWMAIRVVRIVQEVTHV